MSRGPHDPTWSPFAWDSPTGPGAPADPPVPDSYEPTNAIGYYSGPIAWPSSTAGAPLVVRDLASLRHREVMDALKRLAERIEVLLEGREK